jgi:hypothetical protein
MRASLLHRNRSAGFRENTQSAPAIGPVVAGVDRWPRQACPAMPGCITLRPGDGGHHASMLRLFSAATQMRPESTP